MKRERAELVEKETPGPSVRRQCVLLSVPRSSVYYGRRKERKRSPGAPSDAKVRRLIDEIHMKDPTFGTRRVREILKRDHGLEVNRKRIARLMREMGVQAIYARPRRTSLANREHRKYPYLLRERKVRAPDEVWCVDITYIPMPEGHAYLCAVMDWHSRRVLGSAVSNTMETGLCLSALEMAVETAGRVPEIMNSDQGSQFTGGEWTGRLEELGIKPSMDGVRRWLDNVFIERLWRSVKYEDVYLKGYMDVAELERGLSAWFGRYNDWRPHQALGYSTPAQVHRPAEPRKQAA